MATSASVIAVCKVQFARHGIPDVLITDNGTQFTSSAFSAFVKEWQFDLPCFHLILFAFFVGLYFLSFALLYAVRTRFSFSKIASPPHLRALERVNPKSKNNIT